MHGENEEIRSPTKRDRQEKKSWSLEKSQLGEKKLSFYNRKNIIKINHFMWKFLS